MLVLVLTCTTHTNTHINRLRNVSYCPHAEQVVKKIRETSDTAGLLEFQKRWRQHFLSCMEPRFLPDLWSVNHNPQR